MKKILFLLLTLFPLFTIAQTVSSNAELGSRSSYTCWVFQGFDIPRSNQVYPRITGSHSFRSGPVSNNDNPTAQAITTPWIKSEAGQLNFKMRLDISSPQTRFLRVFYIPVNESVENNQGEAVEFARLELPVNTTAVNDLAFTIPSEIIGKTVRFRLSFNGNGGTSRAIVDDIVIPGTFLADPTNGCLPLKTVADQDGDGIADEDDDFPQDASKAFRSYLTNQNYSTLKFEDLWPSKGDYDFNDLVNDLRVSVITNAKNEVVEMVFESRTRAIGAGFRNGLAIELTGILPATVRSVSGHVIGAPTIFNLAANQLEANQQYATVILFDNAFSVLPRSGGGTGVNVEPGGSISEIKTQTVVVSFVPGSVKVTDLSMQMLNPFMVVNQERGKEIHLPGKQPTKLANTSLFGTGSDSSVLGSEKTYLSKNDNLPWAIWINESIPYMQERNQVTQGFEKLKEWANSKGTTFSDWYLDKPGYINKERVMSNK